MEETKVQRVLKAHFKETGESQSAFARRAKIGGSALREIVAGRTRSPQGSTLLAIAKALQRPVNDLVDDSYPEAAEPDAVPGFSDEPAPFQKAITFIEDVPIFNDFASSFDLAISKEFSYDLEIGSKPLGYLPRHSRFAQLRDLFACYTNTNVMAPWRNIGEFVFATRELPAHVHAHVILQLDPDGPVKKPCLLRQLITRDSQNFTLRSYHPERRDETIPTERIRALYRVIEWQQVLLGQF